MNDIRAGKLILKEKPFLQTVLIPETLIMICEWKFFLIFLCVFYSIIIIIALQVVFVLIIRLNIMESAYL